MNPAKNSSNAQSNPSVDNASAQALRKAQITFSHMAEETGIHNENDVQALVEEVRYENKK